MKRRSLLKLFSLSFLGGFLTKASAERAMAQNVPVTMSADCRAGSVVWGVVPWKPILIRDMPGRIRVRLRNDDFGRAFVRHEGKTRHFILIDEGHYWELGPEQGSNRTTA